MHTLIYWLGFAGAWLLVAGPVYQASIELRAEGEEAERVRVAMDNVPKPEPVSFWWWLLPPVHMVLSSRRSNRFRETVVSRLTPEELQALTRYLNIARGWMYVGLGAWFIAWKETYELWEHYEWPTPVFWALMVLMTMVALGLTAVGADRERRTKTADRAT